MLLTAAEVLLFAHLVWAGFYLYSRRADGVGFGLLGGALVYSAVLLAVVTRNRGFAVLPTLFIALTMVAYGMERRRQPRDAVADSPSREEVDQQPLLMLAAGAVVTLILVVIVGGDWVTPDFTGDGILSTVADAISGVVGSRVAFVAAVCCLLLLAGYALYDFNRQTDEAVITDVARSYDYSFLIALVFGGQIVLAMWWSTGATSGMLTLLHGALVGAIATQVYLSRVQGLLDQVAFARVPWLREERAHLREIENLLPRVNMTDPLTIPEDEFAKLTRRALSHYGDLTKLATSPLTNLPEVHRRLRARNAEPATLERARELKLVLTDAIERLKPATGEELGTTDEWRFYNALYYPYVVGMRPYSSTAVHSFEEPAYFDVLDWFRTYVPERTLYNWQTSAAGLVAGHLREQEELASSFDGLPAELASVR